MNIAQTLRDTARDYPNKTALVCGEQATTFAQLDADADTVAAALVSSGTQPGEPVAVVMTNSVGMVAALYGVLRAGGVAVPLNPTLSVPDIAFQLADCGARQAVIARYSIATWTALGNHTGEVEQVFVYGQDLPSSINQAPFIAVSPKGTAERVTVDRYNHEAGVVIYTGGATGTPKGVVLTHGNLLANQQQLVDSDAGCHHDDVVYVGLHASNLYALNAGIWPAVSLGATTVLRAQNFDPVSAAERIVEHNVTFILGAPRLYRAWLDSPDVPSATFDDVRCATSGAAVLNVEVHRDVHERFGLDIREGYGVAEAGPVISSSSGLSEPVLGSVGKPLTGVDVQLSEVGEVSRILVRGPNVFAGYLDDPDRTHAVLDEDGWFDTGDMGYTDEAGNLFVLDRADDLIKISGFHIYPGEIEQVLQTHHAVKRTKVLGLENEEGTVRIVAVVVVNPDCTVSEADLIEHCSASIASYKVPSVVHFVPKMPLLPTGRVATRELRGSLPRTL